MILTTRGQRLQNRLLRRASVRAARQHSISSFRASLCLNRIHSGTVLIVVPLHFGSAQHTITVATHIKQKTHRLCFSTCNAKLQSCYLQDGSIYMHSCNQVVFGFLFFFTFQISYMLDSRQKGVNVKGENISSYNASLYFNSI